MARINPVTIENASPVTAQILTRVKNKIGMIPNLYAAIGQSPAVLSAYLAFSEAINDSLISPALREQIALVAAGTNNCDYCASAHTLMGKGTGVDGEELSRNLLGESNDSKTQAALSFAKSIINRRGWIEDADFDAVRNAGYSQEEIVEIIGVVAINQFTNYFNHIAEVEIDFPVVRAPANAS